MSDVFQRQPINDPNSRRTLNTLSVNVRNPGQTVGPRDVSGITRNADALANALGNLGNAAGRKIEDYITKKNKQSEIEGAIARAQGNTELQLRREGNKSFQQGWQTMDVRVAQNAVKARELDFLETQGGELTPSQYQERLNGIMSETIGNLSGLSPEVQDMVYQGTLDLVPDLVARHTVKHNEYNRNKSKEIGTKALVSTALVDGPEVAAQLMDRNLYPGMSDDDYNEMRSQAVIESLSMGKPVLTDAVIQSAPKNASSVTVTPVTKSLRDLIGRAESSGNYNAVYGVTKPIDLSSLTVRDVQAMQEQMKTSGSKSTAVGKYQFISGTLAELLPKAGISQDAKFTPEVQDKLADVLLEDAGLSKYISGQLDADKFQEALAKTWAGLPKDSSGLSYHAGDGLNAATVDHSEVRAALGETTYNTKFAVAALSQGFTVDQVSRMQKARDAYTAENSSKLTAERTQLEKELVEFGIDAPDETIIARINSEKETKGYSDSWAKSIFSSVQSKREKVYKERAETDVLRSAITTGMVGQLSGEQQTKAVQLAKQDILKDYPDAANPDSPNFEVALASYNKQLYTFLHKNNVIDHGHAKYTSTLVSSNILDDNGNVSKDVTNAYMGYRQGLTATNDPAFMSKVVGNASEVFVLADELLDTSGSSMSQAQALKIAHAELNTNKSLDKINKLSTRDDIRRLVDNVSNNDEIMESFSDVMKKSTVTSIWDYAHMAMSPETSTNASTALRAGIVPPSGSFNAAIKSPEIVARLKLETARIAQNMQGYTGTPAQQKTAVKQAQLNLANRSEYVLGTLLVTEDGGAQSLSTRLGLADRRLGAHVALTDLLSNINEHVYGKAVPEEVFAPVLGEGITQGIKNVGKNIAKAPLRLYQQAQRMVDQGNVPDAHVMLDASQNNVIIQPYVDYDRTRLREPLVIPVKKLKEYVDLMRVTSQSTSTGAAQDAKIKWLEEFKTTLPQYKE